MDGQIARAMHYLPDAVRTKTLTTDELRAGFLVQGLFATGNLAAPCRPRSRRARRRGAAQWPVGASAAGIARRGVLRRAPRGRRAQRRRAGNDHRRRDELRDGAARRAVRRARQPAHRVRQRQPIRAGAILYRQLSRARVAPNGARRGGVRGRGGSWHRPNRRIAASSRSSSTRRACRARSSSWA